MQSKGRRVPRSGPYVTMTSDEMVHAVVCVDDTDDLTRSTSTGEIASLIADAAVKLGAILRLDITRHQLLLSEEVPYTSHNSAMAMELYIDPSTIEELKFQAIEIIRENRAETSDPGLCIAHVPAWLSYADEALLPHEGQVISEPSDEERLLVDELISFGQRAKKEFCSIESAYALAQRIPWISLSEHGGDGAGVVGALSGVGLRLSGNDGRFRGKWDLDEACTGLDRIDVASLTEGLSRRYNGPVRMVDSHGNDLSGEVPVFLEAEAKPVLLDHALTVVCSIVDGHARPFRKADLKDSKGEPDIQPATCGSFEWDNDLEECDGAAHSCRNCLHRRWEQVGFRCLKGL